MYTIGEVSELLNIPISTLRYYDKEGLLPYVSRTSGNIRLFSEQDIECVRIIECLKQTGLMLKDIRQFFMWCKQGDFTIINRYELFLQQKKETEQMIKNLKKNLEFINYKCEFYKKALKAGTIAIPENKSNLKAKQMQ